MSLVSYDVDSDEESEQEAEEDIVPENKKKSLDDSVATGTPLVFENLPAVFSKLPPPKKSEDKTAALVETNDDEFLRKSETTNSIKIVIPSLAEFKDLDEPFYKRDAKAQPRKRLHEDNNGSKLLSILPKAKTAQPTLGSTLKKTAAFVPDSVRFNRPALSTETVDETKVPVVPTKVQKTATVADVESDEEENTADFFSLNSAKDKYMHKVSEQEISELLARPKQKIEQKPAEQEEAEMPHTTHLAEAERERHNEVGKLDDMTLQALAGHNAVKRAQRHNNPIEVRDISGSEILPNRDEWLRSALASSTTYQPTGVMVDEEPVVGTRRKHQITYLAHKAKANEAELQAMWAANRQTRRATQSKYGF